MSRIGGNISAIIQIRNISKNKIGEDIEQFINALPEFRGWLDLIEGDSKRTNYSAKLQESTHIFLCDYFELRYMKKGEPEMKITPENSRMIVNGEVYEVLLYDDPMGMHEHLEIYLKYTGGQ